MSGEQGLGVYVGRYVKKKYKELKAFDCQDMPEKVRKAYFDFESGGEAGNDCWLEFDSDWHLDDLEEMEESMQKSFKIVHKWLMANGASEREEVLIKHWW